MTYNIEVVYKDNHTVHFKCTTWSIRKGMLIMAWSPEGETASSSLVPMANTLNINICAAED